MILIQDAPIDVATEIFTRINVSGQPLSVFEIMVAKTYDHETGFDLAERYKALGVWEDDYNLFFWERCKLIARRLRAWVPKRPADTVGVRPHDEDYDPDDPSSGNDVDAEEQ